MGRKKIQEDLVTQWILARRKGESYRSISKRFDVDPRTVKSWIQRAGEEKEKEHWEAVSRQVDAKYLDQHYRMLLQVAAALLDAVHTDPMSAHQEQEAHFILSGRIEYAVHQSDELLAERGLNIGFGSSEFTANPEIKNHATERLGHILLDALLEHEPRLKSMIEAWEINWNKFQKARLKLIEAAKNLFTHADVESKIAEDLKLAVVQEALRNRIFNEEPRSSRVDVLDDKVAHLVRYNPRATAIVYTGAISDVEAAQKAYDRVLSQLSHPARVNPVQDCYKSLTDQVRQAENYIDRLILIGKPRGHCALCLNRSIDSF